LWSDATFVDHVAAGVAWTAGVDVPAPSGFMSGAMVDEAADRLGQWPVGSAPPD
jgi:hypothetical protein